MPSECSLMTACYYVRDFSGGQSGLNGTLPASITALGGLSDLDLSSALYFGQLPNTLSSFTALTRLVLASNSFNGTIPSSLGAVRPLL